MKLIRSFDDIDELRRTGHFPPLLLDLAERRLQDVMQAFREAVDYDWDPDENGAFAILEDGDNPCDLTSDAFDLGEDGLLGAVWECCFRHSAANIFEVLILFHNDGGWTFFIPDIEWRNSDLRTKLEAEADDPV